MTSIYRVNALVKYLTTPKAILNSKKAKLLEPNVQQAGIQQLPGKPAKPLIVSAVDLVLSNWNPWQETVEQIIPQEREPLTFQKALNEFVQLIAHEEEENFTYETGTLPTDYSQIDKWRLHRAGMLATNYAKVEPDVMKAFQVKFMYLTRHDEVPVLKSDSFNYHRTFEEVLQIWDRSYDLFTGFSHLAYATRRDGVAIDAQSMFERFIQKVNSSRGYKTWPMPKGYTIFDFPGPGIIIEGLRSKVFPSGFLAQEFGVITSNNDSPFQRVEKEYRKLLINTENDLKNTTFGLFRGLIVIRNPKIVVDGKRYALAVFNDHFKNPTGEMAFLVPDEHAKYFLSNPVHGINENNRLFPATFPAELSDEILNLTWPSVLGGMDKALPVGGYFYQDKNLTFYAPDKSVSKRDLLEFERIYMHKETYDVNDHIHRTHMFSKYHVIGTGFDPRNLIPFKIAHDEITYATLFAYAQFDLLKEAFRLYSYGWNYDTTYNVWDRDEFRLLEQAINWRESNRINTEEKPILIPLERLHCARINPALLQQAGYINTLKMLGYTENKVLMLPGSIPRESIFEDPSEKRRIWERHSGYEELHNWDEFQYNAYEHGADLTFVHPNIESEAQGIIKGYVS